MRLLDIKSRYDLDPRAVNAIFRQISNNIFSKYLITLDLNNIISIDANCPDLNTIIQDMLTYSYVEKKNNGYSILIQEGIQEGNTTLTAILKVLRDGSIFNRKLPVFDLIKERLEAAIS